MDTIEMEPVFILMLGKTEDGKRLNISEYIKQIIQGNMSFPEMSPNVYNNKIKKTIVMTKTTTQFILMNLVRRRTC